MKVCKSCGTPQNDSNFKCVECGAILPKLLTEAEEAEANEQISDFIEQRAERADCFARTKSDWILSILDAAGCVLSFVLAILFRHEEESAILVTLSFCFLLLAVFTFFPKLQWTLEKWRVHRVFDVNSLTPSDAYLLIRQISTVLLTVFCWIFLLWSITRLL